MTMHGLIHIVRHKRILFERILWLGFVIAAAAAAGVQAQKIWNRYQTNPVVTIVEKDYVHWEVPYPAITICQKGNTKVSQLEKNNKIKITKNDKNVKEKLKVFCDDLLFSNYYNYSTFNKYKIDSTLDLFPSNMYVEIAKNVSLTLKADKVGARKLRNQHPLGIVKPFHSILTERGVCTTYNSEIGPYFDLNSNTSIDNITNVFKDTVKTYNMQVMSFSTEDITVPYEVFIHSTNEIVDITSRPVAIPDSSTLTIVTFDVTNVVTDENLKSLTPEQRKCRFPYESEILSHSRIYSFNLCIRECRIKLCMEKCNCIPYYYTGLGNNTICNMAGLYCLSNWTAEIINVGDSEQCNYCLPNCEFGTVLLQTVDINFWFLSSQVRLEYISFPRIRYKRFQIFTKTDALVQIGGLFGLFLGCSILSFIELPYFLLLRLYWGVFGRRPIKASL